MKTRFAAIAGTLSLLVLELHAVPTADACGVRLTVKSSAPRKAIARSSNPSRVLLVGSPPRRLERDLTAAGHKVDSAPRADAAKPGDYRVVIVDKDQEAAARAKYGDVVVVRSSDPGSDVRSVEARVARTPDRVAMNRTPDKAKEQRLPVAAGPTPETRTAIASKPASETPAETAPTPTPTPTVAAAPKPAQPETPPVRNEKPAAPEKAPAPERVAVATPRSEVPKATRKATASSIREEIYFSLGSARVPGASRTISKAARWLSDNPDVRVTIEGHADPSGTPDGNMALSQTRADAVKDELVKAGVDGSRIDVNAYGDTKLKYGARDGRNRRVAIEATK